MKEGSKGGKHTCCDDGSCEEKEDDASKCISDGRSPVRWGEEACKGQAAHSTILLVLLPLAGFPASSWTGAGATCFPVL